MSYLAPSGNHKPVASLVKNVKTSVMEIASSAVVEEVPDSVAKKRFAASLRKKRWTIYEYMKAKKRNVFGLFTTYKKMVKKFILKFSMQLKPHERTLWQEKVAKTSNDVQEFLNSWENKKTRDSNIK